MLLTVLAAEGSLAQGAQVPRPGIGHSFTRYLNIYLTYQLTPSTNKSSPSERGRAADTDGLALLETGPHHGGLLPEDDIPGLQRAGRHHVPGVWILLVDAISLFSNSGKKSQK